MLQKDIIVIYHGECKDGFGGAFAAWMRFGDKAEYLGVQHRNPSPEDLKNKEVYFIDFVYKEPVMREIVTANKKVVALDHHISAKDILPIASEHVFDNDHSGSVIAWKYFHPEKPVPKMLLVIEDNDLWKFKVPKSREIFMYLQTVPWDFKEWKRLAVRLEKAETRKNIIEKGESILAFEKSMVDGLIRTSAELVEFEGRRIYAVNSPVAASDIGNLLSKKQPPMAIIWSERDGKVVVSLRSDGTVDVARLAEKYGGGGHAAAAGFSLSTGEPKPWKIIG
jgi:nanoRNase/pAp phosphatase (c-di-AMP/oligoRNAs hydrolase)